MDARIVEYAPIIVVVVMFLYQQRLIITPEQLEKKHREILKEVDDKYATLNYVNGLRDDVSDVKDKVDKIYDKLMGVS